LDSLTDAQLVALTQAGDLGAFNRLVTRWEKGLYNFARRFLGDREEARDLCQDALLKAYSGIHGLRDGARFRPWAFRIVLNLCRDRLRSRARRGGTIPYDEAKEPGLAPRRPVIRGAPGSHHGDRQDAARMLSAAFRLLSPEQRSAILLREFHGFTTQEIAELTGVPVGTVRTRIFYGLRAVRGILEEEEGRPLLAAARENHDL
jgi:RNA polymerase sigma-70 factor, ECF subfamily